MCIETITYKDYNGVTRTETFYFNLTKAEIAEMELTTVGTLSENLQRIIDAVDGPQIMKFFKELIFKAYGEKSADGRRLVKSEELSIAFSQTEAYSDLYMRLITNAEAAAAFVNAIIPNTEQSKPAISISKPQTDGSAN